MALPMTLFLCRSKGMVGSSPGPFPAFQCYTLKMGTRLSFSVCNIEKLGMGLGTKLREWHTKGLRPSMPKIPVLGYFH